MDESPVVLSTEPQQALCLLNYYFLNFVETGPVHKGMNHVPKRDSDPFLI